MVAERRRNPVVHAHDFEGNYCRTICIRRIDPPHAALRVSVHAGVLGGSPEASPIQVPQGTLMLPPSWQAYPYAIQLLQLILIRAGSSIKFSFSSSSSCSASAAGSVRRTTTETAITVCTRSTDRHLAGKCGVAVSPRAVRSVSHGALWSCHTSADVTGQRSLWHSVEVCASELLIVLTTPFGLRY